MVPLPIGLPFSARKVVADQVVELGDPGTILESLRVAESGDGHGEPPRLSVIPKKFRVTPPPVVLTAASSRHSNPRNQRIDYPISCFCGVFLRHDLGERIGLLERRRARRPSGRTASINSTVHSRRALGQARANLRKSTWISPLERQVARAAVDTSDGPY